MEIKRNSKGILYWRAYVDGERVKRESVKWKTRREAMQDYLAYMRDYEDGKIHYNNLSFDRVADLYIEHISLSLKASTVNSRRQALKNRITLFFPNLKITQIDPIKIQNFQRELLEKTYLSKGQKTLFSNEYLENIQTILKSFLDYAVRFEYIEKNPFDVVPFVKRRTYQMKKPMTILTYDEFQTFINIVDDQVHAALFNVLYWCGLRIGEALALQINDYDSEKLQVYKNFDTKNRVITTTKTDHSRVVSVHNQCRDALDVLIHAYKASETNTYDNQRYLFSYSGIIPKGTLDRVKNNYIKEVNKDSQLVPYFTFHELRHTHVSTLINLRMDPKDIADRLGHSVEMVNNTYGHLFPERKDELLASLNQVGQ